VLTTRRAFSAKPDGIAALIPQSLQLRAHVTPVSLGWCYMSEECTKSCAPRSVCCCIQSDEGPSIRLLT